MGCGASNPSVVESDPKLDGTRMTSTAQGSRTIQAPVSFMVPAEENDANSDETSNSIIKAHPPKRFKRLEDEMLMLTQEELQRRHNEAEQRRNAILELRVRSARLSTQKGLRRQARPINEVIPQSIKNEQLANASVLVLTNTGRGMDEFRTGVMEL